MGPVQVLPLAQQAQQPPQQEKAGGAEGPPSAGGTQQQGKPMMKLRPLRIGDLHGLNGADVLVLQCQWSDRRLRWADICVIGAGPLRSLGWLLKCKGLILVLDKLGPGLRD